jgi:SAM-dependent methyltransferase
MDNATFAAESTVEASHWWFVGRRALFARIIEGLALPRDAAVLDIGTSTGTNLRMLRGLGFSCVIGLDRSPEAIRFCADKGLGEVQLGDVCALPFPDRTFDLVLATDIVEHVVADRLALTEIRRVLKSDGHLLLTVPTFRILWGRQDEVAHHKRRYTMGELLAKLRAAGLRPRQHFYFNYLLFFPILMARRLMRLLRIRVASESNLNPGWLNKLLLTLFLLDVRTAARLKPPIGVSALVVATPSLRDRMDSTETR